MLAVDPFSPWPYALVVSTTAARMRRRGCAGLILALAPASVLVTFALTANANGATVGGSGTTPTLTSVPAAAATLATLSALSETHSVFAVGRPATPLIGQTAAKRHPKGTVFSFRLDQPALVNIAIETTAPGRRVGRSCRPETRRLRRRPRCTLTVRATTLIRFGRVGLNRVAFSGRAGQIVLDPGHYRAVFTAVDAAGASTPRRLRFTIVKR